MVADGSVVVVKSVVDGRSVVEVAAVVVGSPVVPGVSVVDDPSAVDAVDVVGGAPTVVLLLLASSSPEQPTSAMVLSSGTIQRDGRERLDLTPGRYPIRTLLSIITVLSSRWGGMALGRLALEERLPATAYEYSHPNVGTVSSRLVTEC